MQEDKAIYQMRFPQKLWHLINLHTEAILWGGTGRTILLNYRILHEYLQCDNSVFKTNNISSFVRQLNLYGFRKVTSHLQDPLCNSSNPFMHEYIHDFFQYGRPELLNKIIRKAINIKKNLKHRTLCNDLPQSIFTTPLQKARKAFRLALKNAAQNIFIQPSTFNSYEDGGEDSCEEDIVDISMFYSKPFSPNASNETTTRDLTNKMEVIEQQKNHIKLESVIGIKNEDIFDTTEEKIAPSNETGGFPNKFLSMPDLDPVPVDTNNGGVELLGEFHINNDIDQGIVKRANYIDSLNCVLPSVSSDYQHDDVIEEFQDKSSLKKDKKTHYSKDNHCLSSKNNDLNSGHYHSEWDQMFSDIITKGQNQESSSDLKELYSQISRTIDLLNT